MGVSAKRGTVQLANHRTAAASSRATLPGGQRVLDRPRGIALPRGPSLRTSS